MTIPAVTQTEVDGGLGVLPPSSGDLLAVVGPSSTGTLNLPSTFGRVSALVAAFGEGPMVEKAALHITQTGKPVVVVRSDKTTAGAYSAVTSVATGTSIVTTHALNEPSDDYEAVVTVVTGGTLGVAGITLQYSRDGGRTMSPVTALGTALFFTFPSGNIRVDFGAGTLVAGDTFTFRTTAPAPNGTQLSAAIDALRTSAVTFELLAIAAPIDATLFDAVGTEWDALVASHKFNAWIGHVRMPNLSETEAAYLSSLSAAFASKATKFGALCAGACEVVSGVSREIFRRPISYPYASREATLKRHQNSAAILLGPLSGVSIVDANGAPKHHDEFFSPGLDDARFVTLRSFVGRAGVFVTRPRIFSSAGSDFRLLPHRRVMNLARAVTLAYLEERLSSDVIVDASTGFILESEALEIEAGGNARLKAALSAEPMASGFHMVVSRTDNLLSTATLNVTTRIQPLAYLEYISESIGFENPALRPVTV